MTFYVQHDGALIVRRFLRTAPFLAGVPVVAETHSQSVDDGPYVTVSRDGTSHGTAGTASENVRINVFAKYEPVAFDLARVIDGYLRDPKTTLGFRVEPGANLLVVPDRDTGGFIAAVTVIVSAPKKGIYLS